jgi:protein-S-isoprenylcysteine O-methyltransferase Ste14
MTIDPAVPDRASVRIFPPAAPMATIAAGLVLDRTVPLGPDLGVPIRVLGGALVLGAVGLLGVWSVILVRRSGQSENPWKPTTGVIQTGPFRVTRNPMYLQMVIGCIGFALLLSNVWIMLLTPLCAALLHTLAIRPEEAYLERKFGSEYRTYKARVRRWI